MFGTTQVLPGATRTGLRRRVLGTAAAVIVAASALTGCAAGQISQTVDQVPNHDGGIGTVGQITVADALLGNADENPSPVAFAKGSEVPLHLWVSNEALTADTLTAISSGAGDVTLSGAATVPEQGTLQIGGDSGVTATIKSATQDIKYGFSIPVDFYFKEAGKLTLQVPVEIPAERSGDRARTDIYPTEETNLWHEPISDNG